MPEEIYSSRTMWLLIAIWSIIMVWLSYIAYEYLNWNGTLWVALAVTYVVILPVIIVHSDIKWY